ncbi:MAG: hypothetical protein M1133_04130 [Armatimonadetes bacterium]|nr:hypothetical protein [Armatimonadota bacterium]
MVQRRGSLNVEESGRNLDIDNGRIRVRLFFRDGGYVQEFHAVDRSGDFRLLLSSLHKNLLTSSEHRSCSSPMISGDRPHLFGMSRESLRMVYSQARVVEHSEERVIVELSGTVGEHTLTCRIILEGGAGAVHVAVDDEIQRGDSDPLVEYVMSSYAFLPAAQSILNARQVDYLWAPNMRPGSDQLIGDCAFHSPAAIVQHGNCAAALIPDLAVLDENRCMPAALDLDINNGLLAAPLISYGFCGYEPTPDRRYCRHDMTMAKRPASPRLSYAFYLMLDAECKRQSAHRAVAKFLWNTYSGPAPHGQSETPSPQSAILPEAGTGNLSTDCTDQHTGMRPQSGWCMLWTALRCLELYESTKDHTHLDRGTYAIDQLCLLQSVRRNPWTDQPSIPGMCARGNVGWDYDPELTAEFAHAAMRYGAITGDKEYFERGTAALNAAKQANVVDPRSQARIAARAEAIRSAFGSAFVHVGKRWAVPITSGDIARLEFGRGGIILNIQPNGGGPDRVVFGGMRGKLYKVRTGGTTVSCSSEQMQSGVRLIRVK